LATHPPVGTKEKGRPETALMKSDAVQLFFFFAAILVLMTAFLRLM
jgi:hypothetical protein